MGTAEYRPLRQGLDFALRGAGWSLALFGLIRLRWFEAYAVLPLTSFQARLAATGFGRPAGPIDITLACSGADTLALCVGAILAYPARWRTRLAGAAVGTTLILALNTVRIGTLGRAAASPSFGFLHLYFWPALLVLAVAAYVFTWMRFADRHGAPVAMRPPPSAARGRAPDLPGLLRMACLTAAFLVVFIALAPLYLASTSVLAVAAFIARVAAVTLSVLGVPAAATGSLLSTSHGSFLVTQECISTPLIPVYFAALIAYSTGWRWRVLGAVAAVPLFVAIGIARLLVVALPEALVGSPVFLVHAFSQLLLAAIFVCLVAWWRHGPGRTAWRRALAGAALGALFVIVFGGAYTSAMTAVFAGSTPLQDPQGAIRFLPAFQLGFFVALFAAWSLVPDWRVLAGGFAALACSHLVVFAALHFAASHAGLSPHVRDVRAWALAGPLLAAAAMVTYERSRR
jgi:exosortase/archaeosortase family protein